MEHSHEGQRFANSYGRGNVGRIGSSDNFEARSHNREHLARKLPLRIH